MRFLYESLPLRAFFGAGEAGRNIATALGELAISRPLVITTEREKRRAHDLLADRLAPAAVFTAIRQHVPAETAAAARLAAVESGADGILSIGGGSTTGTAKAVALTSGLPLVAVPTTYAGSEVTPVWGMTTGLRKETGTDIRVLPRAVVYDPDLLAELPDSIAVASALNAVAHCVEAYWTPRSNPVVAAIATEGLQGLARGLRSRGDDAAIAREQLLYGAFLAGLSFASAGSGLHHTICHALGGAFDLPHAPLHAVVLPHVVAFNAEAAPDAVSRVAAALGSATASEGLAALYTAVDAPRTLREIGLREDQINEAVDVVAARLPIANPRTVTPEDVEQIVHAAFGPSKE
ncbi:maleylacetate reductase [Okibacterium endophyticum]